MNKFLQIFLLSILIIISSTNSFAQLVPDFKVNDDNTSYSHFEGKVGSDSSGNFVIVWQDERRSLNISTIHRNIYCQRYSFLGKSAGNNFIVNQVTDTALNPDIAVRSNGDFCVTWIEGNSFVFDRARVKARLFNREGYALTPAITISDSIRGAFELPKIGCDQNGNFVISWTFNSYFTGDHVYFQMLDSECNKICINHNVSDSLINSRQREAGITVNKDGGFIICWQDNRLNHQSYDIYFQRFNALGEKSGNNTKVNSSLTDEQIYPKISSDSSGNFCITWLETRVSTQSYLTYCQYYSSTATPLGNNLLIAVYTPPTALFLRPNGEAAIGITEGNLMKIQRMNSNRTFLGNSFSISNEVPSSWKLLSDLNISNNKIISVWQDNRNGQFDIYANIRSFSNPDSVTSITQISTEIPSNFTLGQNYPNPFNNSTIFRFDISQNNNYKLEIYNNLGQKIKEVFNKFLTTGSYNINFESGNISSGVYQYILSSPKERYVKSFVLLK
ncbi:MAG: T9SS type A sorting domain-containing protein [Ignavibacteria bacterium]|nr:T9SS type A sorting domain-containing protein [Ignavibacteria bacterium]